MPILDGPLDWVYMSLPMKRVWDRVGIAFSSACVAHCIAVAFLPMIFPALAVYAHSSWVHIIGGALVILTSFLAFIPGYKKHGLSWIIGVALLGIAFIISGILLEQFVPEQISHGVSIAGSLFLVFAHGKNIQHSHRHSHQCC